MTNEQIKECVESMYKMLVEDGYEDLAYLAVICGHYEGDEVLIAENHLEKIRKEYREVK